ncbi:TPA: glycosyltransferase [Pseudomonas aeruginosa]|nr:glycosyltransferase [Pseudomonas aeruginosa]
MDTAACWALQAWPAVVLVAIGDGADTIVEWARRHGVEAVTCDGGNVVHALRSSAVDWVVPAFAGDILHPSLAGLVAGAAHAGADVVAWDWLVAVRQGRRLLVNRRHRAPWKDEVAELARDQRGRTFAVPVAAWQGHPITDAWRVRMSHAAATVSVHPEPLGIYPPLETTQAPDLSLAAASLGGAFELGEAHPPHPRPSMTAPGVSVVLLYRDRVDLTVRAIRSVLAQRFSGRLQLVLVDNQSSAETKATIRRCLASLPPGVESTVLTYDAPFNHSRQCNFGVAAAVEDLVLFLNNDVELLDPDALDVMARWALLPGIATVGACVVDAQGRPAGGGFRCRRVPGPEFNSPVEEASGAGAAWPRSTVGNTFACAVIARSTYLSMGGLDERMFPVGYNDVDFCLRATRDGWRHVNLGQYRVTHAVGASRARTDEVAQKLMLRIAHPWTLVRALQEADDESATLPEARIPDPI